MPFQAAAGLPRCSGDLVGYVERDTRGGLRPSSSRSSTASRASGATRPTARRRAWSVLIAAGEATELVAKASEPPTRPPSRATPEAGASIDVGAAAARRRRPRRRPRRAAREGGASPSRQPSGPPPTLATRLDGFLRAAPRLLDAHSQPKVSHTLYARFAPTAFTYPHSACRPRRSLSVCEPVRILASSAAPRYDVELERRGQGLRHGAHERADEIACSAAALLSFALHGRRRRRRRDGGASSSAKSSKTSTSRTSSSSLAALGVVCHGRRCGARRTSSSPQRSAAIAAGAPARSFDLKIIGPSSRLLLDARRATCAPRRRLLDRHRGKAERAALEQKDACARMRDLARDGAARLQIRAARVARSVCARRSTIACARWSAAGDAALRAEVGFAWSSSAPTARCWARCATRRAASGRRGRGGVHLASPMISSAGSSRDPATPNSRPARRSCALLREVTSAPRRSVFTDHHVLLDVVLAVETFRVPCSPAARGQVLRGVSLMDVERPRSSRSVEVSTRASAADIRCRSARLLAAVLW